MSAELSGTDAFLLSCTRMPDEKGRPTAEELEAHSVTLQRVIEEARALQTAITEELRRLRRTNRPIGSTPERRRQQRPPKIQSS
jgi:hypothetical protein